MKAYTIGGSRNIGYHASLRLLRESMSRTSAFSLYGLTPAAAVTFFLRNPSRFDNDEAKQGSVKEGKVRSLLGMHW